MHEFVIFDNQMLNRSQPRIVAASSAALYGKGVFTTCSIYDSRPFRWDKHWSRLERNAVTIGLDISMFNAGSVREKLGELIDANSLSEGRARVTLFDESSSPLWPSGANGRTSLLIATSDQRPVPSNLRLTISPHRVNSTSPLAGVKSCNYLENILALEEARRRGFDEAIRLNERGEIVSACMANIFWLLGGRLYTPGLSTGCIPGTTREYVIENVRCTEVCEQIENLRAAEVIFLTSAGLGILAVSVFEGRELPVTTHPILDLAARLRG